EERIEFCRQNGIDKSRLILDPGIGFGKRLSDNIEILSNLKRFTSFGLPLLVGASRKSFINMLNPSDKSADNRIGGSLAAAVTAVINGASMVRVHDVGHTVEALKVVQAIRAKT
ncbi:MAG: dihydropteroate synthase, partial [candidate division Zixibacteria bacterium]|nr:dihydropteroate synthase [candidate division Zixibacteria bacterium]